MSAEAPFPKMYQCRPIRTGMCKRFVDKTGNACQTGIPTVNCDPNDRSLWFKYSLPENVDPVASNIYNGLWLCNYEPQQTMNNILCERHFKDDHIKPPYEYVNTVNAENE